MKGCRPLTQDEVQQVLACGNFGRNPSRNRCFFVVGVASGFRCSELLSLRIRDVVRGGVVQDRVQVMRKYMKGKREPREVYLNATVQEALFDRITTMRQQGWWDHDTFLFRADGQGNVPVSRHAAWAMLQRVFRPLGIVGRVGVHSLRKTYANALLDYWTGVRAEGEHCEPMMEVQQALGHKSIVSTQSYLQFRDENKRRSARHMGGYLRGA